MVIMNGHMLAVRDCFARRKVLNCSQQWLEACTEWVVGDLQTSGNAVTAGNVSNGVLQQWLNTDIKECCLDGGCLPSLPADSPSRVVVNGQFCLQIDRIDDMSQPAYGVLQEIRGTVSDNVRIAVSDDQTQAGDSQVFTQLFGDFNAQSRGSRPCNKSSRLIVLSLSDGVTTVEAMETKFVQELNLDLPLGTKVLIKGPVDFRRGTMLLVPGSVEILGGKLEDIDQDAAKNSIFENRLREAISYREHHQNGGGETVKRRHQNDPSIRNSARGGCSRPPDVNQTSSRSQPPSASFAPRANPSTAAQNRGVTACQWNSAPAVFDADLMDDVDEESLIAATAMAEQEAMRSSSQSSSAVAAEGDFFGGDDDDDDLLAAAEQLERDLSGESASNSPANARVRNAATLPGPPSSVPPGRNSATSSSAPSCFRAPAPPLQSNKRPRPAETVISVAEAARVNFDELGGDRSVRVMAFVDAVRFELVENAEKAPRCRPYLITMPVALCDGQDSVKFLLGTAVMEKLTGVTAEEILRLLEMRGPRAKEMVSGLKRTLRDDVRGVFTLKQFSELADAASNVVIVDYERVDDLELEAKWRERRQAQKRPRSGS